MFNINQPPSMKALIIEGKSINYEQIIRDHIDLQNRDRMIEIYFKF